MEIIKINNLTKDYGNGKGIFDVTFTIKKGEIFGFLGPNGAGKTTTIRHLLGFIIPKEKKCIINGLDCNKDIDLIQKKIGYIPGEINLMEEISGIQFIKFMADYRGMKNLGRANELIKRFELDPRCKIKKMSKGMKQKVGIVIAFMHDPDILILDEPTSGLDPLMQNKFVELIHKAKKEGKTILMSSHIFEEVEHTCDRVVIIKEGEIVATEKMEDLRHSRRKYYEICFHDVKEATLFHQQYPESQVRDTVVSLSLQGSADTLIKALSQYTIDDLSVRVQSLEELFLHYYGGNQS